MASPSATWTGKTVKVTYRNPLDGTLEPGSWYADMSQRVVNTLSDGSKQVFRKGRVAAGSLVTTGNGPSLQVELPVVDDPDNSPTGGSITLTLNFSSNGGGSETYVLSPLESWPPVTELANVLDPIVTPAAPPVLIKGVRGGVAALDAEGYVLDADGVRVTGGGNGGGGTTLTNYSQVAGLPGYPASFPATSHTHPATAISDSTTTGRAVLTAANDVAARAVIGAGTSSLALGASGTTSGTLAVAGNDARLSDARTPTSHTHPASAISDSTAVGRSVLTAATQTAARTALGISGGLDGVPAGYVHSITDAQARANGVTRATFTTRSDILIRVWGGSVAAADPAWFIVGDFRDDTEN